MRRPLAATVAGVAVVGFAAALLSPTGMAAADPSAADDSSVTAFSIADEEAQNLTVTIAGEDSKLEARGAYEVYIKPKPKPKPKPVVASDSGGSDDSGDSGGGAVAPPRYTGGGSKEDWMRAAGIAESDWGYVDYIVSAESGWNPNATNPSSGACGLVQALPCSKVPGNGYDPVDNLRWGSGYATGRYGSWAGAYAFWTRNHWW